MLTRIHIKKHRFSFEKSKEHILKKKLKANTANPKFFWETLALSSKRSTSSDVWLKKKEEGLLFNYFTISEVFQKFYSRRSVLSNSTCWNKYTRTYSNWRLLLMFILKINWFQTKKCQLNGLTHELFQHLSVYT